MRGSHLQWETKYDIKYQKPGESHVELKQYHSVVERGYRSLDALQRVVQTAKNISGSHLLCHGHSHKHIILLLTFVYCMYIEIYMLEDVYR